MKIIEFQYIDIQFGHVEVYVCVDLDTGRIWDWEIINFDGCKECIEIFNMLINEYDDMPRLENVNG